MEQTRLSSSVRKVIRLETDAEGNIKPVTLFERSRKQKKMTGLLRPLEKVVRRAAGAQAVFAETYASRHRRSNAKTKDGWVRDLPLNLLKATRCGFKKSPLGCMFPT
jgi:hypothetical protein